MTKNPHWRDCLNSDGSYNVSAIMRIAIIDARKSVAPGYSYQRAIASALRMVWEVAIGMKCSFNERKAA